MEVPRRARILIPHPECDENCDKKASRQVKGTHATIPIQIGRTGLEMTKQNSNLRWLTSCSLSKSNLLSSHNDSVRTLRIDSKGSEVVSPPSNWMHRGKNS